MRLAGWKAPLRVSEPETCALPASQQNDANLLAGEDVRTYTSARRNVDARHCVHVHKQQHTLTCIFDTNDDNDNVNVRESIVLLSTYKYYVCVWRSLRHRRNDDRWLHELRIPINSLPLSLIHI